MFDTVNMYIRQDSVSGVNLLAEIPVYLERVKFEENADGIKYSGRINDLYISVTEKGLFISGSLPKYYLSDNMQTLRRQDTVHAIQKLSDDLHVSIKEAQLSRIDFAHNFIMNYHPKVYYSYLGESQYFERFLKSNSLYYENSNRTKLFYD